MAKLTDPLATERPTPRLVGGQLAQLRPANLEAEGQGLQHLGSEAVQGMDEIYRAQKVEQEKIDTTRVEDAWNQYKQKTLDLTMGEGGLFHKRGADAVNGNILQTLTTRSTDASKQIASTLQSDEQRTRFSQRVAVTDLHAKQSAMAHLDQEFRAYDKTTMLGSEAAAKAAVSAEPLSPDAFKTAHTQLMLRADDFMRNQGVTDKGTIDKYKSDLSDGLWASRIDTLLYQNPVLAEAVFRAHADHIKNPEIRLKLQHRVVEASLGISAEQDAQKAIDRLRIEAKPVAASVDALARALMTAEGSGPEATSVQGAKGRMQITEDTFNAHKKQGESFDVEADRVAVAQRKIKADFEYYGGDVRKVAAAYIGGRGAVDAKGNIRNVKDALGTTAVAYADKVEKLVAAAVDPMQQNTSGRPSSRELSAQLPALMGQVQSLATEKYGPDQNSPVRAAYVKLLEQQFAHKVSQDVQQQNALQRVAQGTLIDAIVGASGTALGASGAASSAPGRQGAPAPLITSYAQIAANPELLKAWQMVDSGVKPSLIALMEKNLHAANDRGDIGLYRELFNRIHLEPGDPKKIDFYKQIIDPENVARLSPAQVQGLRAEIDRSETPGGRSIAQMRKAADARVENYFKTHLMFTAQPDRAIAAGMAWNEDVGKKMDAYVAANQADKVRAMFQLDTPESVLGPLKDGKLSYLERYVNSTPAQGGAVAQQAAAPIKQPAAIDTREKRDAWFKTLPANVTQFTGTDGKNYMVPRAAAPGAPQATPTPAPSVMNETGKLVAPPAPLAPEQEITISDISVVTPKTVAQAIEDRRTRLEEDRAGGPRSGIDTAAFGKKYAEIGTAMARYIQDMTKAIPLMALPAGPAMKGLGEMIAQAIPTDMDSVMNAWSDIKRTRVVSHFDAPLIERALEYGLNAKDEKLARKILKKLEAAGG